MLDGLELRHTHRVPPIVNEVLPTVAWGHLQVGTSVLAVVSCGSWDSRHPSHGWHTFTAIDQWGLGVLVADEGLSNVCSAAGLGALLQSERIRDV